MRLEIPFNGPAYKDDLMLSPQECTNFYLHPYPGGMALLGSPGLELWVDLSAEIRGSLVMGDYLYVVAGRHLYRLDKFGTTTSLGTINTSTHPLSMASNGLDIVISDGVEGFVYDIEDESFSQITDEDFPAGVVVQIDGYYLSSKPGTGQVWRSDYNDGSSWGSLAFSTAGKDPDNVISLHVDHSDVWVFGERTTEIWYNTGEATFNFAPIPGATIEQGIVSSYSRTSINRAVYWIGQSATGRGSVFQAVGRQPKIVSTSPIEMALNDEDLSKAFMWSYHHRGQSFVVISLQSSTWVYDSTLGEWHRRSSLHEEIGEVAWVARNHVLFDGYNVIGCYDGKLSRMKSDVYTENGNTIIGTRVSPVIRDRQTRITIDEVQIVNEPGVGVVGGDSEDEDPKAMFSWSRDGGHTWSPEMDMPLGKAGMYGNRSVVTQLGQGVNWVFKYRVSAAVKRSILGAVAEVTEDE